MMHLYDYVYQSGRVVRVKADEASLFDVFAASPGLYRVDEYDLRTGAFIRAFAIYRVCGHITPVQLDGNTDTCSAFSCAGGAVRRICGGWAVD